MSISVGQKIGMLTVISFRTESRNSKKRMFIDYVCDCGNRCAFRSDKARHDCGCLKKSLLPELIGRKFGSLLVTEVDSSKRKKHWICKCDCGSNASVSTFNLVSGQTVSCGCLRKHMLSLRQKRHGKSGTNIYLRWRSMLHRCLDKTNKRYTDYGGRGITVCDEWLNFSNFYSDMGDPPSKSHQIDRIDNNKGYCKENCRWVTNSQNSRNKRDTVMVVVDGCSVPLITVCEIRGLRYHTVMARIRRGMLIEDSIK